MASTATALVPIEESSVAQAIDGETAGLLALLGTPEEVARFKRVVIMAISKNPELLECTPASVTLAVFEAAAQGLEPTGAAGGAHLVPFNVNVGTQQNPRWEKRAQLIPDYRGVVRMVTRPDPRTKVPSEVVSIEARVVKEGDEFAYEEGTNAAVHHVPALAVDRSTKPTTHVYAVAHLRSGPPQPDVMDRSAIERIRSRGKKRSQSPWDTDWDEMAKKTVVKRLAKLLPVSPEVRTILSREDELEDQVAPTAEVTVTGSRTAQLAARLQPQEPEAAPEPIEAFDATPDPITAGPLTPEQFTAALRDAGVTDGAFVRPVKEELFGDSTSLTDDQRGQLAAAVITRSRDLQEEQS